MSSYRVRRLPAADDDARRYHLFDREERLLLVADQGSPWLPPDKPPQVRFSRPTGERVASMDLPLPDEHRRDQKQNYAIIHQHAVYALLTMMPPVADAHDTGPLSLWATLPFSQLVIEVEGNRWLALPWPEGEGPLLTIYDAGESGLANQIDPASADLPEPIGLIEAGLGDYTFELTLPTGRLEHEPLLGLALVYLVDTAAA